MPNRRTRHRRNGRRPLDLPSRDRLVAHGLPRLLRAARHELAIRESEGDLLPGQVDAQEVVDQALAEMLPHLSAQGSMERALVAVQHRIPRILDALVARNERERQELEEVEGGVPVELPTGEAPTDVDDVEGKRRRRLLRALFLLPADRRRLFEAVVMDGWRPEHVAATFGMTDDQIGAEIDLAVTALVERLGGLATDENVRLWYETLGERLRDEHAAYFSPGQAM
jgi:DNA-directed RNA polymerase specialized sigma24 family protein